MVVVFAFVLVLQPGAQLGWQQLLVCVVRTDELT